MKLVVTAFVTLDGIVEAPGFDEHRTGRNAWALRVQNDEDEVYNRAQVDGRRRAPARPSDVADLGGVLADRRAATSRWSGR